MRVLLAHNAYQQRGGEDVVFESELDLLRSRGNKVSSYLVSNNEVLKANRFRLAADTLWSSGTKRTLQHLLRETQPHVAHFHNTFPLISPAGYAACRAEGVPVVQTLHNYRLLCPNALFFRDGHVCEDCMGKIVTWPGVAHSCYRGSRAATGVTAAMLTTHRVLHTWAEAVDVYVALTEFARQKFIEGGLPAEKLVVKPNFVWPDPGPGEGGGRYALFVGRLSPEKGVNTLLAAWELVGDKLPLKIVGNGPMSAQVEDVTKRFAGVEWLGSASATRVYHFMGEATVLVFPSEWYETFGRVAVEAFARGTPVIGANIGAIGELIDHGRTGLHFRPGDPEDLAARVDWILSHPLAFAGMRRAARAEFETKYTADRNYEMLVKTYETAMARTQAQR
jgi:glycosyltransferase involved in cell wall biosynthesis